MINLSIIGTGFISKHFLLACKNYPDIKISKILTRRQKSTFTDFPYKSKLTNDPQKILKDCDMVLECSGDPLHAFNILKMVAKQKIPIATMNSEFQITYGSEILKISKMITECQGDQPGSFAAFKTEIEECGFSPIAYLNFKKYLNFNPSMEDMKMWANKLNQSISTTISATDGTKVETEQALIANYFNASISRDTMIRLQLKVLDFEYVKSVFNNCYQNNNTSICDYIVHKNLPKGIAILANHNDNQKQPLNYVGLDGPPYLLIKNYHLCHLEIIKTLRKLYKGEILLNNTLDPKYNIYAVAKTTIKAGTFIRNSFGNILVRGICAKKDTFVNALPLGKLQNTWISHDIYPAQIIKYNDVEGVKNE